MVRIMKKIVFIASSMGRGGAERVMSILSREYCNENWSVDIIMTLHNINEYPLDSRVRVIDFSFENISNPIGRKIKMILELRKYLRNEKPDIVVPFLTKIAAITEIAMLGVKRDFRVVTSERIDPYSVRYSKALRWLINLAFQRADAVVFQTERAQSYYSNEIQKKSVIIGNPISVIQKESNEKKHIIISAGRLEPQKNHKMLIKAFASISNEFPEYELHIYGEGKLQIDLEQQIQMLGMKEKVLLKGNCVDYLEKIRSAEVFVLSSDYEGLSNALLEAMMIGIPCISTACAGSNEVIKSGENGLLIPIGDEQEMIKALTSLLSHVELRETFGTNGRNSVQRFRTENVISMWKKVLEGN